MPRLRQDLTGKKFGKLTATKRSDKHPTKWECICDCGTELLVKTGNLNYGSSKSCGCSRDKRNKDYTGQKFKSWTVISKDTKKKGVSWYLQCQCGRFKSFSLDRMRHNDIPNCKYCSYIGKRYNKYTPLSADPLFAQNMFCRCDCGTIKSIKISEVIRGELKSCGCLQKDQILDITLHQFGKLTALKRDKVLTDNWICECECGNLATIRKAQLISGCSRDCGCILDMKRNLLNQKFDSLTVLKYNGIIKKKRTWTCKCECGNIVDKDTSYLHKFRYPSCGCKNINKKYPGIPKTLKILYKNMQQRCYNKKLPIYKWYGGKGISICDEWLNDKLTFYAWALSHGYSNKLELDRQNGGNNYTPDNCRFVTKTINLQNRPSKYNV